MLITQSLKTLFVDNNNRKQNDEYFIRFDIFLLGVLRLDKMCVLTI